MDGINCLRVVYVLSGTINIQCVGESHWQHIVLVSRDSYNVYEIFISTRSVLNMSIKSSPQL